MSGCGVDLALCYAQGIDNYDYYVGQMSQTAAVSIEATTKAYVELIEHPELRAQLGQNAVQDVSQRFDWPVILQAYQRLWAQLAEIRLQGQEQVMVKPGAPANPGNDFKSLRERSESRKNSKRLDKSTLLCVPSFKDCGFIGVRDAIMLLSN